MEATAILTADHNRARGLFTRWQEAIDAEDMNQAESLSTEIIRELRVHMMIEEETFYPAVHDLSEEISATVDEGLAEHHQVDGMIAEISALASDDPQWKAKMTVLIEDIEHHAGEEESDLFPPVRGKLDAAALDKLGQRLEDDKRLLDAQTAEDSMDLTLSELRKLASEQKIPGRSSMDHDELAATVQTPSHSK